MSEPHISGTDAPTPENDPIGRFRLTDEQRIALGYWPRTLHGWWFWFLYWSPAARLWRRRIR